MKAEFHCSECDNFFTIKYKSGDEVKICPFCGEELILDDANEYDDENS